MHSFRVFKWFLCLVIVGVNSDAKPVPDESILEVHPPISIDTNDLIVLVNESRTFNVYSQVINASLTFDVDHSNHIEVSPSTLEFKGKSANDSYRIYVTGIQRGRIIINGNLTTDSNPTINAPDLLVRIVVAYSSFYIQLSAIAGWAYTGFWIIAFWPQIIKNFQRKSVVGLNFDFVAINILGNFMYFVYNYGSYYSTFIEDEHFRRFPKGMNPVKLNDVIFAAHSTIASTIAVIQCCIYERGNQRVSDTARAVLTILILVIVTTTGLAICNRIHWLDFLLICSYIKLLSCIKTIPQAYMNFKRKSTVGWAIGTVITDFAGGILSMLQMLIDAYNYDDFNSIFGDPTKFWLGFYSSLIEVVFMVQHFVLYREREDIAETKKRNLDSKANGKLDKLVF